MSIQQKWYRFKELPQNIDERLAELPVLLAEEGALLAYLFGSQVREGSGNDIDLALFMPEEKRPYTLQLTINKFLDTERVDIIDLRRATPVMRFEIMSTGKCIYAVDEDIQLTMELSWLREFKDTAWLRQKHEQALRERISQWSSDAKVSSND